MEEELVDPLLADAQGPALLLEVDVRVLPLLGRLLDEVVHHLGMEAVEDFIEKVPLREPHLILASWIREVVCDTRESQHLLVHLHSHLNLHHHLEGGVSYSVESVAR